MPESQENLVVSYWNCRVNAQTDQQVDYISAIQIYFNPDLQILTECPEATYAQLEGSYPHVYYEPAISRGDVGEGICVVSDTPLKIGRQTPWPVLMYRHASNRRVTIDGGEIVRIEVEKPNIGAVAVFAAHISHFHPMTTGRRHEEWSSSRDVLFEETLPWLLLADTNTTKASTVRKRLGLSAIGADLVPHEGGRTWGFGGLGVFYLDRVAASQELLPAARLFTLPRVIVDAANPSDHRAILAIVNSAYL